jgi:flagellar hook-length control protein FliK
MDVSPIERGRVAAPVAAAQPVPGDTDGLFATLIDPKSPGEAVAVPAASPAAADEAAPEDELPIDPSVIDLIMQMQRLTPTAQAPSAPASPAAAGIELPDGQILAAGATGSAAPAAMPPCGVRSIEIGPRVFRKVVGSDEAQLAGDDAAGAGSVKPAEDEGADPVAPRPASFVPLPAALPAEAVIAVAAPGAVEADSGGASPVLGRTTAGITPLATPVVAAAVPQMPSAPGTEAQVAALPGATTATASPAGSAPEALARGPGAAADPSSIPPVSVSTATTTATPGTAPALSPLALPETATFVLPAPIEMQAQAELSAPTRRQAGSGTPAAPVPPAPALPAVPLANSPLAPAAIAALVPPADDPVEPYAAVEAIQTQTAGAAVTLLAPQPAAATAPADMPAPIDTARAEWVSAIMDQVAELREAGSKSTLIRLLPDALGAVDVRIDRRDDGATQVSFAADNPQARAMLAEAAPRLVEMAEARGLRFEQAGVGGGNAGSRQPSANPQPQQQAAGRGASSPHEAEADPAPAARRERIA